MSWLNRFLYVVLLVAVLSACGDDDPADLSASSGLYRETFEDGVVLNDGWQLTGGGYLVAADEGAAGTRWSAYLMGGGLSDYLGCHLPRVSPSYISLYLKTARTNVSGPSISLTHGAAVGLNLWCKNNGQLVVGLTEVGTYTAGVWMHIELTNITYTDFGSFDLLLDGVHIHTGSWSYRDLPYLDWITFNNGSTTASWLDEIVMR